MAATPKASNLLLRYFLERNYFCREVVVAQLVVRLLPRPEVCGSNPLIGKIHMYYYCIEKMKIKEWPNSF